MEKYINIAKEIFKEKYSDSNFLVLAGSLIRGEGTKSSDLDIVVIYDKLEFAFRESFIYEEIMIEVFVHDISTLRYFMYQIDLPDGAPILANMITEGIIIPRKTELSIQCTKMCEEFIAKGPKKPEEFRIKSMRYSITNLIDDLIDSKNRYEQIATGCKLYDEVAELYFSSIGKWNGKAKSIVRVMNSYNPEFALRFNESFDLLFRNGNPSKVVEVTEEVLNTVGGYLFEGYRLEAKPEWRIDETI